MHIQPCRENYFPAGEKLSKYFAVNGYTEHSAELLHEGLEEEGLGLSEGITDHVLDAIVKIIDIALRPVPGDNYVDYQWLNRPQKRKRRR